MMRACSRAPTVTADKFARRGARAPRVLEVAP